MPGNTSWTQLFAYRRFVFFFFFFLSFFMPGSGITELLLSVVGKNHFYTLEMISTVLRKRVMKLDREVKSRQNNFPSPTTVSPTNNDNSMTIIFILNNNFPTHK